MRTRIALVAITPIACITVSIAALTAAAPMAGAATSPSTTQASTTTAPAATTTTPPPSSSSTTPVPTTTSVPPAPAPSATPSTTVPPFPGLRAISPVLTETTLLVNLNTALRNEAALHQAVQNEATYLEAMAALAQYHQALVDEVQLFQTVLSQSRAAASRSSAGSAVAAMGLPYTTSGGSGDTVTPGERAAWERVAVCEEGGNWHADGGRFSGGLGITRTNWIAYGGGAYAPEGAMASEDEQIMVAERIQSSPPDQGGCHSW
jgi:hypothetical protein